MNRSEAEQQRLREFLTSPQIDPTIFSPGFTERVGADELRAVRDQVRARFGEFRSLVPDGRAGTYRVTCADGSLPVAANVDAQGRLAMLWLGVERPEPGRSFRERALLPLVGLLVPLLVAPGLAAAAALCGSRITALSMILAALAAVPMNWLLAPWAWISQYGRAVAATVSLVLLAVAAVRLPGLPTGHVSYLLAAVCAVLVARCLLLAGRSREGALPRSPLLIANPLPGSRALVLQGGGPSVNHHASYPAQRYALDLLCLDRRGARARGPAPSRPDAYHAYGATVAAPCDAMVVGCVDGFPDQPVQASPRETAPLLPQPAVGNHLALLVNPGEVSGAEKVVIILAHLRKDSILVEAGQTVTAGQPLAQVGNSGNTTEPHLHLHAESRRPGPGPVTGIPLRLVANPRRPLRRGTRLDR